MRLLRKLLITLNCLLAVFTILIATIPFLYFYALYFKVPELKQVTRVDSIAELASLPPEEIDLFYASLLLAKEAAPDIDIEQTLAEMDALAIEFGYKARPWFSQHRKTRALYDFLFKEKGFKPANFNEKDLRNVFMDQVLQTKTVDCNALTMINMGLAFRLDIPLSMMVQYQPYHYFVANTGTDPPLFFDGNADGFHLQYEPDYFKTRRREQFKLLTKKEALSHIINNLGASYYNLGFLEESNETFKRALYYDPNNVMAACYLANTWRDLNKHEAAHQLAQFALTLNTGFYLPHFTAGLTHLDREEYQSALTHFEESLCYQENNENTWNNIGYCYRMLKQPQKAIESYKTVLLINERSSRAHFNLGLAYFQLEKYRQSSKHFKKLDELNPDDFAYHLKFLFMSAFKAEQYQEALQYAQKAEELKLEVEAPIQHLMDDLQANL